ncbi:MAG: single-stranded DNA-binding protein [Cyanobacteriota bacterium]|nr:single-stranded DNA-binding protein [Cyanobacteriota bacterium]
MNHCLLEVEVLEAPQVRYTQDNQTPVAEMTARFDGLRPEDPPGQIKVVGWGNLATDLQNRVEVGQRWVLEGRLRMNTLTRQDGVKEKRAELTLARLHPCGASVGAVSPQPAMAPMASPSAPSTSPGRKAAVSQSSPAAGKRQPPAESSPPVWNTSPLVPDELGEGDDDIPF